MKQAICAWCDAHSLDVADGEIVDLVRRVQSLDVMAGSDAEGIERMATDLIHLAADRIDDEPAKATRLRVLAAHISAELVAVGLVTQARCLMPDGVRESGSPSGTAGRGQADDDGAPGRAMGEEGQSLRYDEIYYAAIRVTLHGQPARAI